MKGGGLESELKKAVIEDVKGVLPPGVTAETLLTDEQIEDIFEKLKADPRLASFNLDSIEEKIEAKINAEEMTGGARKNIMARREATRRMKQAERERARQRQMADLISENRARQLTEGQLQGAQAQSSEQKINEDVSPVNYYLYPSSDGTYEYIPSLQSTYGYIPSLPMSNADFSQKVDLSNDRITWSQFPGQQTYRYQPQVAIPLPSEEQHNSFTSLRTQDYGNIIQRFLSQQPKLWNSSVDAQVPQNPHLNVGSSAIPVGNSRKKSRKIKRVKQSARIAYKGRTRSLGPLLQFLLLSILAYGFAKAQAANIESKLSEKAHIQAQQLIDELHREYHLAQHAKYQREHYKDSKDAQTKTKDQVKQIEGEWAAKEAMISKRIQALEPKVQAAIIKSNEFRVAEVTGKLSNYYEGRLKPMVGSKWWKVEEAEEAEALKAAEKAEALKAANAPATASSFASSATSPTQAAKAAAGKTSAGTGTGIAGAGSVSPAGIVVPLQQPGRVSVPPVAPATRTLTNPTTSPSLNTSAIPSISYVPQAEIQERYKQMGIFAVVPAVTKEQIQKIKRYKVNELPEKPDIVLKETQARYLGTIDAINEKTGKKIDPYNWKVQIGNKYYSIMMVYPEGGYLTNENLNHPAMPNIIYNLVPDGKHVSLKKPKTPTETPVVSSSPATTPSESASRSVSISPSATATDSASGTVSLATSPSGTASLTATQVAKPPNVIITDITPHLEPQQGTQQGTQLATQQRTQNSYNQQPQQGIPQSSYTGVPRQPLVEGSGYGKQLTFDEIPKPTIKEVQDLKYRVDNSIPGKEEQNGELKTLTLKLEHRGSRLYPEYVTVVRGPIENVLKYIDFYRDFLYKVGFIQNLAMHPIISTNFSNEGGYSTLFVNWQDIFKKTPMRQPAGAPPNLQGLGEIFYKFFPGKHPLLFAKSPLPPTNFKYNRPLNHVFVRTDNPFLAIEGEAATNMFTTLYNNQFGKYKLFNEEAVKQEVDGNFILVQYEDDKTKINIKRVDAIITQLSFLTDFKKEGAKNNVVVGETEVPTDVVEEVAGQIAQNTTILIKSMGVNGTMRGFVPLDNENYKLVEAYASYVENYTGTDNETLKLPSGTSSSGTVNVTGLPGTSSSGTGFSNKKDNSQPTTGLSLMPTTESNKGVIVKTNSGTEILLRKGYNAALLPRLGGSIVIYHPEGKGGIGIYKPPDMSTEQRNKIDTIYMPYIDGLNKIIKNHNVTSKFFYHVMEAMFNSENQTNTLTFEQHLNNEEKNMPRRVNEVLVTLSSNGTINATELAGVLAAQEIMSGNGTYIGKINEQLEEKKGFKIVPNSDTGVGETVITNYFKYFNYKIPSLKYVYGSAGSAAVIYGLVYLSEIVRKLLYLQDAGNIPGIISELKEINKNWDSNKQNCLNIISIGVGKTHIDINLNQGYKDLITLLNDAYGDKIKKELTDLIEEYERFHARWRAGQLKKFETKLNNKVILFNKKYTELLRVFDVGYQYFLTKNKNIGDFTTLRHLLEFRGYFNIQRGGLYKQRKTRKYKIKKRN
jgi:hypothetical protein